MVEDSGSENEGEKSNQDKILQSLVDRVLEVSKQTNQDQVIMMLKADKEKLEQENSRLKLKNKGLKAKLNELYEKMLAL